MLPDKVGNHRLGQMLKQKVWRDLACRSCSRRRGLMAGSRWRGSLTEKTTVINALAHSKGPGIVPGDSRLDRIVKTARRILAPSSPAVVDCFHVYDSGRICSSTAKLYSIDSLINELRSRREYNSWPRGCTWPSSCCFFSRDVRRFFFCRRNEWRSVRRVAFTRSLSVKDGICVALNALYESVFTTTIGIWL